MTYFEIYKLFVTSYPVGSFRTQDAQEWTGTIALPQAIQHYYRELGPVDIDIPNYGNSFFLPRLSRLWPYQSGYRWHAHTEAPLSDWKDTWIVLGDHGGDPFIFSVEDDSILYAQHGRKIWNVQPIFPSIFHMSFALLTLGAIVEAAGDDFTDEDSLIREVYLQQGKEKLSHHLSDQEIAHVLLQLEWQIA